MDLSVIVVEYRSTEVVKDAVTSFRENLADFKYEIIVISNSVYGLELREKLKRDLPGVNFIFNEHNVGFSKANNQGMRRAIGEIILLINPDAKLLDRSVHFAVELMKSKQRVAIVGPLIIDKDGVVQDSCRDFMTGSRLLSRSYKRFFKLQSGGIVEKKDLSRKQQVDWVSGACMLVRRASIKSVGYMDERYFMYMEDMDWCRTFWINGWEVWHEPKWRVEHNAGRGSSSRFHLANKLLWIHLLSYCKYLLKWLWRPTIHYRMYG